MTTDNTVAEALSRFLELSDEMISALAEAEQATEVQDTDQKLKLAELALTMETIGYLQRWAFEAAFGLEPTYRLNRFTARSGQLQTHLQLMKAERASAQRAVATEEFNRRILQPQ